MKSILVILIIAVAHVCPARADSDLEKRVAALEKELLIDALKNSRGNISHAADMLKTTVRKFSYKAQKYNIDYKTFRQ